MPSSFNSGLFFYFFEYNNFIFIIKSVVTCILSGYLYAVGGHDGIIYLKTVERYNPVINEWTYVASMGARRGGVGVATLGGCLYATGGYDGTSNLSTSGMSWLLSHAAVKPVYNGPLYSGHPVYYNHRTTSQNVQLPYIFCKVDLYTCLEVTLYITVILPFVKVHLDCMTMYSSLNPGLVVQSWDTITWVIAKCEFR